MSSPPLTVCCVLWVGRGNLRRNYTAAWVRRLRDMVAKNLTIPHRFLCLSNVSVDGVERVPLELGLRDWWPKIELFLPRPGDEGTRLLYLDLDVLVTGSLDDIATFPAPIAFAPPHPVLTNQPDLTAPAGVIYRYQSSCMVWSPPVGYEIASRFHGAVRGRCRGDQDWIAEVNPDWPTMPAEWFAKLRQCPQGPKPGVKVVIGDGKWKPDTAPWPWVKRIWQGDGDIFCPEGSVAHAGH